MPSPRTTSGLSTKPPTSEAVKESVVQATRTVNRADLLMPPAGSRRTNTRAWPGAGTRAIQFPAQISRVERDRLRQTGEFEVEPEGFPIRDEAHVAALRHLISPPKFLSRNKAAFAEPVPGRETDVRMKAPDCNGEHAAQGLFREMWASASPGPR